MLQTVLVVDDDPDIRMIAEMSLGDLGGLRVFTASDGADAVREAERLRPDLMLLDVMMPVLDGPSTLALLRASKVPDTPVVFLTAKTRPADVQALLDAGGDAVIAKPFDPITLPDEVRAAWERCRKKRP